MSLCVGLGQDDPSVGWKEKPIGIFSSTTTARTSLIIVLLPVTGLALSQQELAVWFAALVALIVLVMRSRKVRAAEPAE